MTCLQWVLMPFGRNSITRPHYMRLSPLFSPLFPPFLCSCFVLVPFVLVPFVLVPFVLVRDLFKGIGSESRVSG